MGEERITAGHEGRRVQPAAGAAGEHHVGPAPLDHARRLGHGQEARHVTEHDRIVGPAGIVGDRDV